MIGRWTYTIEENARKNEKKNNGIREKKKSDEEGKKVPNMIFPFHNGITILKHKIKKLKKNP